LTEIVIKGNIRRDVGPRVHGRIRALERESKNERTNDGQEVP
jgi:hypothetical protein